MAKTTEKITVRFTIDFFGQKIIGTKASFTKASKGTGAEYEELAAKMAAHPTFVLVEKEQKHKSTRAKRVYDGLDFPFMEDYISIKDYDAVNKAAEDASKRTYPLTQKLFLGTFGTKENPFDMEKAHKDISDFRITHAKQSVAQSLASSSAPAGQEQEVRG